MPRGEFAATPFRLVVADSAPGYQEGQRGQEGLLVTQEGRTAWTISQSRWIVAEQGTVVLRRVSPHRNLRRQRERVKMKVVEPFVPLSLFEALCCLLA